MRNRADEDARLVYMSLQMGSEPPSSLRKDLDHLMFLVSLRCLRTTFHTIQPVILQRDCTTIMYTIMFVLSEDRGNGTRFKFIIKLNNGEFPVLLGIQILSDKQQPGRNVGL